MYWKHSVWEVTEKNMLISLSPQDLLGVLWCPAPGRWWRILRVLSVVGWELHGSDLFVQNIPWLLIRIGIGGV